MHIAATSNSWLPGPKPKLLSDRAIIDPITIAPELTMLFAATVRAVSDWGTVVVRKA